MYHKGVCEYLMMKGLTILVITYVYGAFAAASIDDGMYCTGSMKKNWTNSMEQCQTEGGISLSHNNSFEKVMNTNIFIDGNASVWTADYLLKNDFQGNELEEQLCGFIYKYKSTDIGQKFFGSCDTNRFYICWNSSNLKWQIYEGHYKYAIEQNCGEVDDSVLGGITDIFKSGYYWMKDLQSFERKIFDGWYTGLTPYRCGAFSKDAGPYFRLCTDKIQTLCHFVNTPPLGVYEKCFKDSTTTSKRSTLTTSFAISSHIVTTQKPYQNQTSAPREEGADNLTEEEERDLGTTVGVSVGLCLALICGVICAIYMSRRYRCWKTISSNNNKSKANYQGNMSSSGRVITHTNLSYDATQNEIQTVEYSLVNKTGIKVRNAEEQTYVTEQEYDVSGNVQRSSSNTSNNVYNTFQSGAYDSTSNVCREVLFDSVYGRTQDQDTDSVYDSTGQTIDSTQCDSVYNHLSEGSTKEDQTYYASTVTPNTNKLDIATDQTYDKLK